MSTRNRHVREDGQKAFAGRVSKWRRQWVASSEPKSKGLQFQRWVQTGECAVDGGGGGGGCGVSKAAQPSR